MTDENQHIDSRAIETEKMIREIIDVLNESNTHPPEKMSALFEVLRMLYASFYPGFTATDQNQLEFHKKVNEFICENFMKIR